MKSGFCEPGFAALLDAAYHQIEGEGCHKLLGELTAERHGSMKQRDPDLRPAPDCARDWMVYSSSIGETTA